MNAESSTTLGAFLEAAETRRKTLTVFAPESYETLAEHFESRNVVVEHVDIPDDGSGGFVVVSEDGEFVGSVGAAAVRSLVEPNTRFGDAPSEATRALLELLADTTFVSFDKRQMLGVAREIEDRAFRRERGTLRTGFQALSAMVHQQDVYETLATETDLDVHVYGRPDWNPPEIPGATVHAEDAAEIGAFWFVVFDGGGDDAQACALVAEEVRDHDSADESEPSPAEDGNESPPADDGNGSSPTNESRRERGTFRGFWTYDAETVVSLGNYLRESYD